MGRRGRLAARDPDVVLVDEPQEHPAVAGIGDDGRRGARHLDHDGVEELPVDQREAGASKPAARSRGPAVDAAGNAAQALGAVVHGVHGSDDRQQDLRRADVGGGLLAADVLLPRLQGEPVGRAVLRVDGEADQASGQVPLEAALDGHVRRMRPAVPERDAEALGGADGDVGPPLPRRLEQRQRQEVGRHRHQRPLGMGFRRQGLEVAQRARAARVLLRPGRSSRPRAVPALRSTTSMTSPSGPRRVASTARVWGRQSASTTTRFDCTRGPAAHERDGLGHGGALVEQGGVGRVEPGEIGHHRLEVQEGLQPALADLGLVRRVRRVPRRALEHVAPDDAGRDGPRSSRGRSWARRSCCWRPAGGAPRAPVARRRREGGGACRGSARCPEPRHRPARRGTRSPGP